MPVSLPSQRLRRPHRVIDLPLNNEIGILSARHGFPAPWLGTPASGGHQGARQLSTPKHSQSAWSTLSHSNSLIKQKDMEIRSGHVLPTAFRARALDGQGALTREAGARRLGPKPGAVRTAGARDTAALRSIGKACTALHAFSKHCISRCMFIIALLDPCPILSLWRTGGGTGAGRSWPGHPRTPRAVGTPAATRAFLLPRSNLEIHCVIPGTESRAAGCVERRCQSWRSCRRKGTSW